MNFFGRLIGKLQGESAEDPGERKKRIVGEYVNACSRYANQTLADESLLPHPKKEIQEAMLWLMETNPRARPVFASVFIATAIYQKGVGSEDTLALLDVVGAEMEALRATLRSKGIL